MKARIAGATVLVSALTLAGCTFTSPENVTPADELVQVGPARIPVIDVPYSFESTAELVEEAPIIVVARYMPGSTSERTRLASPEQLAEFVEGDHPEGPRAHIVEMTVVEALAGDAEVGDVLTVVSYFDFPQEPGRAMLTADSDFLLFMGPASFVGADSLDGYFVLGWYDGYFQRAHDETFNKVDPSTSGIPEQILLPDVRAEVARLRGEASDG